LLLKLEQYEFKPITSQDSLALMWTLNPQRTLRKIAEERATLNQGLEVIRHPCVHGGGINETLSERTLGNPEGSEGLKARVLQETLRCITDYLANGLPLVVQYAEGRMLGEPSNVDGQHHALMVMGMHLLHDPEDPISRELIHTIGVSRASVAYAELPGRLVVHDSLDGIFVDISTAEFLERAWRSNEEGGSVSFLAIAPRGTSVNISTVRWWCRYFVRRVIKNRADQFFRDYADDCRIPWMPGDESTESLRLVTRLLQGWQVRRRYTGDSLSFDRESKRRTRTLVEYDPDKYWWCVEVRLAQRDVPEDLEAEDFPRPGVVAPLVLGWPIDANGELPKPQIHLRYDRGSRAGGTS
jgi:hypothetical protein